MTGVAGLALASAQGLVTSFSLVESFFKRKESGKELEEFARENGKIVLRFHSSIQRYSLVVQNSHHAVDAFNQAITDFEEVQTELEPLLTRKRFHVFLNQKADKVRECRRKLSDAENRLHNIGIQTQEAESIRRLINDLSSDARNTPQLLLEESEAPDDPNLYTRDQAIPEKAMKILNALSRSGLSAHRKLELKSKAEKLWTCWRIDPADITNKGNHYLGRGASASVIPATLVLRDLNNNIIPGKTVNVAVKEFTVSVSQAEEKSINFFREIFLQKDAEHPCIIRTFGGVWPNKDQEQAIRGTKIHPMIVMERMTHNLKDALTVPGVLDTLEAKRKVIFDVLEGICHLHGRGIIHRDIKSQNVLLRISPDYEIEGRVKLCDFNTSRKVQGTHELEPSDNTATITAGTKAYLPPEGWSDSAQEACKPSRDIWSFGVLLCELLRPDFMDYLNQNFTRELRRCSGLDTKIFARVVVEQAQNIEGDPALKDMIVSCLFLDPALRPRAEEIVARMKFDAPLDPFRFEDYYTSDFREKEILRFARNYFDDNAHIITLDDAIRKLEKANLETEDMYARSVLGYCYLFGIGVVRGVDIARQMFEAGCKKKNDMAMYAMGVACFLGAFGTRAEGAQWLKESSRFDNVGALKWYALCYLLGIGETQDPNIARKLTLSAVEEENQDAEANLAMFTMYGIGTSINLVEAVSILHRYSASGSGIASNLLANCYAEGIVVPSNEEIAEQLRVLAKKRGIDGKWGFNQNQCSWYKIPI